MECPSHVKASSPIHVALCQRNYHHHLATLARIINRWSQTGIVGGAVLRCPSAKLDRKIFDYCPSVKIGARENFWPYGISICTISDTPLYYYTPMSTHHAVVCVLLFCVSWWSLLSCQNHGCCLCLSRWSALSC